MQTGHFAVFFAAAILLPLPATAQQNRSEYSSVAAKNCKKVDRVLEGGAEISGTLACRGIPGYEVLILEADLRTTVAIGRNRKEAQSQPAGEQSFAPFNSVHDTLEWRLDGSSGAPIATIQRWRIADNENLDKDGRPNTVSLLVVTRTPPGASCHVTYIDVRANEKPNALAQKAADELAKNFDCAKDKIHIVGKRGRAAELAEAR